MRRTDTRLVRTLRPWLKPWLAPWPWLSLGLLLLCMRTEPPRLWFWLALLLISLLVGMMRALARER
ncbi:MAG: hypothetical protein VKO39_09960 [Cyanobacteriota bacterium]|nr:hypothetical protein [Cyanobacteriota bacterium]